VNDSIAIPAERSGQVVFGLGLVSPLRMGGQARSLGEGVCLDPFGEFSGVHTPTLAPGYDTGVASKYVQIVGFFGSFSPISFVDAPPEGNLMKQRKLITTISAVLLWLVAVPAQAQLDAGNRPETTGPLTTGDQFHDCRSRVERFQGEVAGRFKICYWYFLYDPDRENSPRNFAGFWAQGTVTPVGQWCARRARLDLDLPASSHVHTRAPRAGTVIRTSSSRRYTTRLEVDAQGHAADDAAISNKFRVFANRTKVVRADNGDIHRMAWSGGAGRTLAFVTGVEVSYRPGARLPTVSPKLFAFLQRTGTC
jgi:hypothetical protein